MSRALPLHTAQRPSGAVTFLNTGLPRLGTSPVSLLPLERTSRTHEKYLQTDEERARSACTVSWGEGARPAAGAGSLPAGDAGVPSSALGCPPRVPRAPVPAVPDPPSAATSPVPAAAPGTPCAQMCPPLRLDRAAGSPGRERRFRLSPLDPRGHACGNQPHGPVHSLASNALNAKKEAKKKESK